MPSILVACLRLLKVFVVHKSISIIGQDKVDIVLIYDDYIFQIMHFLHITAKHYSSKNNLLRHTFKDDS